MGRDPRRHGYRKGDNKAGGGGPGGGGGKRGRAPHGWEKGDQIRDFADVHEDIELPRKPGSPHHPPRAPGPSRPSSPAGRTITDALRATNAKVLTTLRKLEATSIADEERREVLRASAAAVLLHKRRAEEQLFPLLLDHRDATDGIAGSRDLQTEIDHALERLLALEPSDRDFALAVRVLHGMLEQQIELEHEGVLTVAERVIPADQAVDLASRLHGE